LRTYASQVLAFITHIRAVHQNVPMAIITPVLSLPREKKPNAVGSTLGDYRTATAEVVRFLQENGDQKLFGIDGDKLFSKDEAGAVMPDTLHPNNAGYRLMAERLGPQLAAIAGLWMKADEK
jgi:lysophospholipase L1-like esterase